MKMRHYISTFLLLFALSAMTACAAHSLRLTAPPLGSNRVMFEGEGLNMETWRTPLFPVGLEAPNLLPGASATLITRANAPTLNDREFVVSVRTPSGEKVYGWESLYGLRPFLTNDEGRIFLPKTVRRSDILLDDEPMRETKLIFSTKEGEAPIISDTSLFLKLGAASVKEEIDVLNESGCRTRAASPEDCPGPDDFNSTYTAAWFFSPLADEGEPGSAETARILSAAGKVAGLYGEEKRFFVPAPDPFSPPEGRPSLKWSTETENTRLARRAETPGEPQYA